MSLCSLSSVCTLATASQTDLVIQAILPSQTTSFAALGVSPSGQSIVFANSSRNVFLSTDFGATFTQVSDVTLPVQTPNCARVSDDGRFLAVFRTVSTTNTNKSVAISTDGGSTWASVLAASDTNVRVFTVNLSADGQFWCISGDDSGGGIYVNSSYGSGAWTRKVTSSAAQGNDMSASGKYILVAGNGADSWYSRDYGQTFLSVDTGLSDIWGRRVAVSEDGRVGILSRAGIANFFYSTGLDEATPAAITNPSSSTVYSQAASLVDSDYFMNLNFDGSRCFFLNTAGGVNRIYVSEDNLQTSAQYAPLAGVYRVVASASGKYMIAWTGAAASGQLYRITDTRLPDLPIGVVRTTEVGSI